MAPRPIAGRLVIATHNPGKLVEMRELLAIYGVEAISAGELGLPEPEETGTTFRANARIKAQAAATASNLPAFADVRRGQLRLLLSGPQSSAGRPMPDGVKPAPGGWNRIHLITADLATEIDRLRGEGVRFRNDVVSGPGGSQILLEDPAGNLVELFQPAG